MIKKRTWLLAMSQINAWNKQKMNTFYYSGEDGEVIIDFEKNIRVHCLLCELVGTC